MDQILLEHGQADQECVLLLRLDLGQVAAQVLTQLLALSPGEASGCKHLVMMDDLSVSWPLTCVVEIETSLYRLYPALGACFRDCD